MKNICRIFRVFWSVLENICRLFRVFFEYFVFLGGVVLQRTILNESSDAF